MAIRKDAFPILEYDDDPQAILTPFQDGPDVGLPRKAVLAFLDECVDERAALEGWPVALWYYSIAKQHQVYKAEHEGQEVCVLQMPVGAATAAQLLDWLISCGVQQVIAVGSCGVLIDLPEDSFLVPKQALRDEGTSYHYLPPARTVETSAAARAAIEQTLDEFRLPWDECMTWTTDGFFRETEALAAYRRAEGCTVVEMECAALAACAQFRGVEFGQLLFTADSLADAKQYDPRSWGMNSQELALLLGLEAVCRMKET